MDINKIREVVNDAAIPYESKKNIIISIIAHDQDVIPAILVILQAEREVSKELLSDTNLELSRALIHIDNPKYMEKRFVIGEIKRHYLKWQHKIRCCFKFQGLP
jgi:hypothetical protein